MPIVRTAILIICVAGVIATAATGLLGEWLRGGVVGWGLIVHMAASPLMILGFAAAAVVWGTAHRFDRGDDPTAGVGIVRRLLFWLLMVCGLVCMTTMLAAMLPVFGYIGQAWLAILHEISGIGVVAAGLLYVIVWFVSRSNASAKRRVS